VTHGAITGALLVDGTGDSPQPGTTVIWENDRITWVGPEAAADLAGTTIVEAGGGALLPGLIDSHVHLCVEPTLDGIDQITGESPATLAIRSAQSARRLLDAGITTARDQGSREGVAIEVAGAQRNGWLMAARILAAGRGITPSGGHGWMIGVEADGPAAVRAAVTDEMERGADVIKIFSTGGVVGSGAHGFDTTMDVATVRAAVEEAHRHGVIAGAHIHGPRGIDIGLEAGVDTIEHGTGVTDEQAERMAAAGVALVPTLSAIEQLAAHRAELPADLVGRMDEVREVARAGVRRAIATGVAVLPGTDAGTPFNPHGNLAGEIRLLADLGLGNAGAIQAATATAARVLRLDNLGTIEVGARADLALFTGDPIADLALLDTPRAVVQDGKVRVL